MKRLPLTLLTLLVLFGAFRVYALVVGPMTRMKVMPVVPPVTRIEGSGHASHAARDAAKNFLSRQPWAQNAKFTWEHHDQKFIYFNEIGPVQGKGQIENKNQYRFRPFAMIVRNPKNPEEPPTVLAADEARVTFKEKIEQFGAGDSGDNRIVGAELDANVSFTGPNGLSLTGSHFVFSEATRSLYSDEPLQFTYGPTEKSQTRLVCDAEDIAVTLQAGDSDLLGKDLPRIADFEHLTLRRNVRFQIDYENRGVLTPVRVTSAGSFEFNRERRKASFDRDVELVQRTSTAGNPPLHNVLECQRLELLFDDPPAADPAPARDTGRKPDRKQELWDQKLRSLAGLTLHYIVAFSPPRDAETPPKVKFTSEENSLTAAMDRVTFNALDGVLSITDPVQSEIERHDPKAGTITRLLTRRLLLGLESVETDRSPQKSPEFQPIRRKFGGVEWIMCAGLGRLLHLREATGETLLDASWNEKLSLSPDESSADPRTAPRLLELTGKATVIQGIDRGVQSDVLTLTLPPDVFHALDAPDNARAPKTSLPVRRAHAKGNVRFSALEAEGRTDVLDVLFVPGMPPATQGRSPKPAGARATRGEPVRQSPPWNLKQCQRIEAEVVLDPETMDAGVTTATVVGPLVIERPELTRNATDPADGPVRIAGQKLLVTNGGADRQLVVLQGRMHGGRCVERALLRAGVASLEGQEIQLDRARSTMNVAGQTQVTWPIAGDLTGRQLAAPTLMTVSCADGLTFDGQEARFLRSVVVRMQDESQMSCEELIAGLDRPWSFGAETQSAARPEVAIIRSPGRVRVNMLEWEKSALSRVVDVELGAFEVHPREGDGAFRGRGPGTMTQWQRGSFHFRVTPEASASANRPAASAELPWNFVRLDFEGRVTGNLHQRFATFEERVKAIYAPVGQARTPFDRQALSGESESAKRAVWVGCDLLNVSLSPPKPGAPNGFITLNAQGRVELEAQKVQANAYQISFEEEKDVFELRGRGEEMASVYFDAGPERGRIPGRVIQFNPKTGSHRIVEAGTVTGGN